MWVNVAILLATLGVSAWAIGFTLVPLFERKRAAQRLMPGESGEAREEENAVLASLADLDLDYGLGRIPEAEYLRAQESLRRRALVFLTESHKQELALDSLIEEAVASRRRRPRVAVDAGTCPQCRKPVEQGARFCARCGARLSGQAPPAPRVAASQPAKRSSAPEARARAVKPPQQQAAPRVVVGNARGKRWLIAGAGAGVAFLTFVAWLYVSSPSFKEQVPLSTVPARAYQAMLVSPANANLVLLSYDNGLLASVDGGRDWRPANITGNVRALAASLARPKVLYAAGPNLLSRSEDGGATWQALPLTLPEKDIRALAAITDAASETLYAAAGATGLYASRDQGQTWEPVSNQVPVGTVALVTTPGLMEPLFVATRSEGVLAGDGKSWGKANGSVNSVLPTMDIKALAFDAKSGDRAVMPTGGVMTGALYAGTENGLFKSTDGGGSWNSLPFAAGVQALALDPSNSGTIYVVDRQGRVFRSSDRGLTWTNS